MKERGRVIAASVCALLCLCLPSALQEHMCSSTSVASSVQEFVCVLVSSPACPNNVEALRGSAWAGEEAVLYETGGEGHIYFLGKAGRLDKAEEEMAAIASFMASSSKARLRRPSVRSSMGLEAKL